MLLNNKGVELGYLIKFYLKHNEVKEIVRIVIDQLEMYLSRPEIKVILSIKNSNFIYHLMQLTFY